MLIDDIISRLSDSEANLSEALLKTKIFLHQIGSKELAEWVNKELNGYNEVDDVPDYRIMHAQVRANMSNAGWRVTGHPIPILHLSEDERRKLELLPIGASLQAIRDMHTDSAKGLRRSIPMEFNFRLGESLGSGLRIESAWCEINPHELKSVEVNVRSRLLDFLLEIKDKIGSAEDQTSIKERIDPQETSSMFHNAVLVQAPW